MDFKNFLKEVKEYLINLFWFILVIKYFFFRVGASIGLLIMPLFFLIALIQGIYFDIFNKNIDELESYDITIKIMLYPSAFLALYFLAKVFKIFKKLDKINFFVSAAIICAISYMLVLVGRIDFLKKEFDYEMGLKYSHTMYFLIPAFLLYKFLNFLTLKFPRPFKKIGYYTSIEFWVKLYSKFKNIILTTDYKALYQKLVSLIKKLIIFIKTSDLKTQIKEKFNNTISRCLNKVKNIIKK